VARRDEILNAIYEADRLHKEHDTEARAKRGEGRIDVFGMLVGRDIPVMFRPLKNLLGAYIDDPDQGVMVTTQRPLPVYWSSEFDVNVCGSHFCRSSNILPTVAHRHSMLGQMSIHG
jgi:hypothetical protein